MLAVKRSLTISTLLQMGIRITLVVIATALLSYWHIVNTLENETRDKLLKYISERGHRESQLFLTAEHSHKVILSLYQELWDNAPSVTPKDFFSLFEKQGDGTTRLRKETYTGIYRDSGFISKETTGFIGRDAPVDDPEFQRRVYLAYQVVDRQGTTWEGIFGNTWMMMQEGVNVVHWPGNAWSWNADPALDIASEEWSYVTNHEHNPDRTTVYTGLYYDGTADDWMVSVLTPLDDANGKNLTAAGHDILLNDVFDRVFNDKLDGTYNFIFREDGRIIAHPQLVDRQREKLGVLTIAEANDAALQASYTHVLAVANQEPDKDFFVTEDIVNDAFLAVTRIKGPNWWFVTVYPKSLLSSTAGAAAKFVLFLGLAALAVELLMLLIVLRQKVITPIRHFVSASDMVSQGNYAEILEGKSYLPTERADEIGALAKTFHHMAKSIRDYQVNLETQVGERTRQLADATAEAKHANEAKTDFLARMSHEIRTPMNSIIGMTHLVLRTDLTSRQRNFVEKAKGSAEALLGIINDILDYSKIEAGKLTLENTRFDLNDILGDISAMITLKADEKNLEIIYDIAKDVPRILRGDPLRLGQVLLNLANNAVKFTHDGEVVLRVRLQNISNGKAKLVFSIVDTGIGLTQDQIKNLFNSFSQADDFIARKYGGTGLGLAICSQLCTLMGGKIWVDSEPGKGSEFSFTATFDVIAYKAEESSSLIHSHLQDNHVLVVDDNETAQIVLREMLGHMGFRVQTAGDGETALALVEQCNRQGDPFDLVITDWKMPGMDGIDVTKRIKSHPGLSRTPAVLMVTAYGREEVQTHAEAAGVDGFLIKPASESTLFDLIIDIFKPGITQVRTPSSDHLASNERLRSLYGCRILLAEDNAINLELAREFLADVKARIETAGTGAEAVEKLDSQEFDVVLMDVQMPVMDGLTATRIIRENAAFANLPIIAMTAQAMAGDREKCLEAGMNDYLTKPMSISDLHDKLLQWVDTSNIPAFDAMEETSEQSNQESAALTGAPSSDAVPSSVIDTAYALSNFGGRYELYQKMLDNFRRDYGNVVERLEQSLASGDMDDLDITAHTLKSIARYLGAMVLGDAAENLEMIAKGKKADDPKLALDQFSARFSEVMAALQSLPAPDVSTPLSPVVFQAKPGEIQDLFEKLGDALRTDNAEAEGLFLRLRGSIDGEELEHTLNAIQELIEDIEYGEAFKLLWEIKPRIMTDEGDPA